MRADGDCGLCAGGGTATAGSVGKQARQHARRRGHVRGRARDGQGAGR